jgi:N-acetylmuramoyl-L-alanine amidase
MISRNHCFSVLLFLALALPVLGFNRVIIDPGHGGYDRGGGYEAVYEKHLALDTARRLQVLLQARGISCIMTRTGDSYPSLEDRSKIGNSYGNAIFVSVHYNEFWRTSVKGLETFYHHKGSYPLAAYVQSYMVRRTNATNRGVKRGSFHVIRETTKNPAILVECGFVSNETERRRMVTGAYRQMLAEGIAKGILEYREAYH